jgi:hypothetical protein
MPQGVNGHNNRSGWRIYHLDNGGGDLPGDVYSAPRLSQSLLGYR